MFQKNAKIENYKYKSPSGEYISLIPYVFVCISVDILNLEILQLCRSQVLPEMWQEVASYIGPKEGDPFAGRVAGPACDH